ncbi:ARM repeat-containing protein [Neoconidiobolus thromboides FSU 785]|nr:ARM repeat-containing protein [Neoconidiobolus thromboides FSU 785]
MQNILEVFSKTLQADPNIRKEGEQTLKSYEGQANLLSHILELISSKETPDEIKLSASVYIKNRIKKAWANYPSLPADTVLIDNQDKLFIKANILKALPTLKENIREILSEAICFILDDEFPDKWTEFIPTVSELINSEDYNLIHCGLLSLRQLFKVAGYRTSKGGAELIAILADTTFPQILSICNTLVADNTNEAALLIRLSLKIYRDGTKVILTKSQQEPNTLIAWGNLFIRIIEKELPPQLLPNDLEEREDAPWVLAQKWAAVCLNLLFNRYGNPSGMSTKSKYYKFAKQFVSHFAPNICNVYLKQLYNYLDNKAWVSKKVLIKLIDYFGVCFTHRVTWDVIKPHTERLIKDLIYPNLGYTATDEASWEDNPSQFINQRIEIQKEKNSLTDACLYLLEEMVESKKKYTLNGLLDFVIGVLSKNKDIPSNPQTDHEKDAALAILECIDHWLIESNSKIRLQTEQCLVQLVLPELKNPNQFVRYRACSIVHRLSELQFSNESTATLCYENVLPLLSESQIQNRVIAALTIGQLLQYETVISVVENQVPQIMEQLLFLTSQVDVEPLSLVIEVLVEAFNEKLVPYTSSLCESLVMTLKRLFNEIASLGDETEQAYTEKNDKIYSASGIIRTIVSLLYGLEGKKDILFPIEPMLVHVVHHIFTNNVDLLFEEAFELADGLIYSLQTVTPGLWEIFDIVHSLITNNVLDYFSHAHQYLDSIIIKGNIEIAQNRVLLEKVYLTISHICNDNDTSEYDKLKATRLLILMILNLQQCSQLLFEPVLKYAFQRLVNHGDIGLKRLTSTLVLLVVSCLAIDFSSALHIIEENGWTSGFFTIWFQQFEELSIVHDKKLCIVALCNVIKFPYNQLPETLKGGWAHILNGVSSNFKGLPDAEKSKFYFLFLIVHFLSYFRTPRSSQ